MRRAGNLFDCPRMPKSCFNACNLSSLYYCDSGWISAAESHLFLRDSIVHSAERLFERELCCLGHRRKVGFLGLLCKIYHSAAHSLHEYLHHFVATRNTTASAALCELALVISRCGFDRFSRAFLLAAVRLWSLLPSGVFSGDTLSSIKSAMNLCLLRA